MRPAYTLSQAVVKNMVVDFARTAWEWNCDMLVWNGGGFGSRKDSSNSNDNML